MKKLVINLVSESEFTVQGHGVHTAYLEMRHILESQPDVKLLVNDKPKSTTDITHIHTFGFFSLRRLLSRKGGLKVVSAHVVPDSLVGSIVGARAWMHAFKYYLRWFYNRANLVIAVSPYTEKELLRLGVKRPIVVLPNSIDTDQYKNTQAEKRRCRRELGLSDDKFIIIGNGQIQPRKKFDTFINIADKLPDVQFIWIGGIPFKAAGAGYAKLSHQMKHAPDNVLITDVISLERARLYMKTGDLMFMPSTQETFGLAIIEGAACGMPVIVRNIHDYDATFGDLVTRSDEKDFAELIRRFMVDGNLYADGQRKSKQLAEKYDSKTIGKQLMKLYRQELSA